MPPCAVRVSAASSCTYSRPCTSTYRDYSGQTKLSVLTQHRDVRPAVASGYVSTIVTHSPTSGPVAGDIHIRACKITADNQVAAPLTPPPSSPAAQQPLPLPFPPDPVFPLLDSESLPARSRVEVPFALVKLPALQDLTPTILRTLISSDYGSDVVYPNVSSDQYEAWLRTFPELLEANSHDTRLIYFTHAYTLVRDASGQTAVSVPSLIVKCMPSPWHEACSSYIMSEAIQGVARISPGGLRNLGLRCRANWEFSNFTPSCDAGSQLSRTAKKIPDVAFGRLSDSFPTLAVEVGFSELWPSLLEDARLFLTATENVTKVVLLIKLVEQKANGDYANPITGQKVKCWKAKANMFRWPGTAVEEQEVQGGDPADAEEPPDANSQNSQPPIPTPPPPPDPKGIDSNPTLEELECVLETYFLATDALGILFPPLIAPLTATLYRYRRRSPEDTIDANGNHTLDLFCTTRIPFLEDNEVVRGAKFALGLHNILASDPEVSSFPGAVEYDLELLAQDIVEENRNMQKKRARVRAKKVLEHWVAGIRKQTASLLNSVRLELVVGVGEKETRSTRKRVRHAVLVDTERCTSFVGFKKQRLRGEDGDERGYEHEDGDVDGDAEEEDDDQYDNKIEDEDWTEEGRDSGE